MSALMSVAVLGGGVLGLSTAVQLLRGGADVLLVTEAEVGSGASGRSLSWLNAGGGYGEDYYRLRTAGIDRYRTLLARNPGADWLAFDGGLYWDDDPFTVVERHNTQTRQGYDARLLDREDVPGTVPGVDPGVLPHRVLVNPGEGWVSLPHLVRHLAEEFTLRGGTLIEHAGRCTLTRGNGNGDGDGARVRGLRTAGGEEYAADAVVVACGAGTPAVLAETGVNLPDASDPAMLVISEPLDHGLRAVLNTPRVSLRPHPGGRLAMDHTWYLDRVERLADGSWSVDPAVPAELAAEASRILAGHPEVVPQSWLPGLKPVPGDGEPVLGELAALPGCWAERAAADAELLQGRESQTRGESGMSYDSAERRGAMAAELETKGIDERTLETRMRADISQGKPATEAIKQDRGTKARKGRAQTGGAKEVSLGR